MNKNNLPDEKKNYQYCQYALSLRDGIETQFLLLGKALYEIREKNLYRPQWESFEEYCMELRGFSSASISKLINIYRVFVLEYQIPVKEVSQAGWTLLAETLPHVHDNQSAKLWVDRATLLTRTDLVRELKEQKSGKSQSKCKHAEVYMIRVCRDCGERVRIYE
jgi:hypothetical protein